MPDPQKIKDVVKVQQPTLAVETEHVDVIQAKPAEDVLRVKQPLSAEEDAKILTTAGQRQINFIWESTQSIVAISVTGATLYVSGALALRPDSEAQVAAFVLLSNVFFAVISTYIQRTNHQKVGGVKTGDTGR